MIKVLEIGAEGFDIGDFDRRNLQKKRRIECSKYLISYDLILHSPINKTSLRIERETENLTVYHVGGNRLFLPFKILATACSIIKRKKIDVVSSTDPFIFGLVAYILKLRFKIPINTQLHLDYLNKYFWNGTPTLVKVIKIFLMRFVFMVSDSLRPVSLLAKQNLENITGRNKIIEVIPTPVNLSYMNSIGSVADLCAKYRRDPETKLLLFVGRLGNQKGLPILLRAFKLTKESYENVRLLIVGMGDQSEELKKMALNIGIDKDVFFLGSIKYDLLSSYYRGSDVFVTSSRSEGRPTVLTEAALFKKPIVATRFTGTQDLIVDGQTGFVVDIDDFKEFSKKVLLLLNNPKMIKEFGGRSYEYVTKKTKSVKSIKALVKLWEKTVKA